VAQLIVALDLPAAEDAERLIDGLYELDVIFKIGLESLYGYPERIFSYCEARDVRFFVDAKLHDIPRTAAAAMRQLIRPGAHIVNVHALGGSEMMRAAVEAASERAAELGVRAPHVFAVTILTSHDRSDLHSIGLSGDLEENALHLATLARNAGCSGVVCSAWEASRMKREIGSDFLTLTPGIRPGGGAAADQKRVMTPAQAVDAGADYLVVGRPITEAADPFAAAKAVLEQMHAARSGGVA
jgi:orotidine-5'-phosphate decarboxylase